MSDSDRPVACVDMGSLNIRVGWAGDDSPQITTRSLIGYPKYKPAMFASGQKYSYIGDEAISKRGVLSYRPVMHHGENVDWDHMEMLWTYLFENELRVGMKDLSIVSADAVLGCHSRREKTAQILFENFNVREWYCGLAPVMALYGTATPSGLSVCIGDGVTQLIPIVGGSVVLESAKRINFGGRNITKYLNELVISRGYYFENSSTEQDIIRDVKEKFSYTTMDYWSACQQVVQYGSKVKEYLLPDGNVLSFGKELFQCNEAWFDPTLVQKEYPGIHQMIYNCVESMDIDNKREMYENIVLSGAATLTEGFCQRLQYEVQQLIPESVTCRVVAGNERHNNVWLGCSVLGSMTNYLYGMTMKSEEYDENGPSWVHRKFMDA
ncbi:hypothetical protein NAEGRDRAFT_46504 [Naegleria gruberi]|uniref:Actin n=1 Tax=Naegleria gruberi TaxID=5762 RepID=D2V3Y5_NAEGR|nr:uncharacterized protein NAEGRDRAFT_46504 [Naegleria gruberi]EFC48282.1 hypothetical protein NAEGRDRAFT_46504 [Naegleria gruberi]|eukprot:XP_002681026.1 hypothetical protein NAEGRDRAFT_46504 [Naegleria gruberi strain NEG-M]